MSMVLSENGIKVPHDRDIDFHQWDTIHVVESDKRLTSDIGQ